MLVLLRLARKTISLTVKSAEFGSWSKFVRRDPNDVCLRDMVMSNFPLCHLFWCHPDQFLHAALYFLTMFQRVSSNKINSYS